MKDMTETIRKEKMNGMYSEKSWYLIDSRKRVIDGKIFILNNEELELERLKLFELEASLKKVCERINNIELNGLTRI